MVGCGFCLSVLETFCMSASFGHPGFPCLTQQNVIYYCSVPRSTAMTRNMCQCSVISCIALHCDAMHVWTRVLNATYNNGKLRHASLLAQCRIRQSAVTKVQKYVFMSTYAFIYLFTYLPFCMLTYFFRHFSEMDWKLIFVLRHSFKRIERMPENQNCF